MVGGRTGGPQALPKTFLTVLFQAEPFIHSFRLRSPFPLSPPPFSTPQMAF